MRKTEGNMQRTVGCGISRAIVSNAGAVLFFVLVLTARPLFAVPYNATPVNVDPAALGLSFSDVSLGDFNNDGFLDVLMNGTSAGTAATRQLRIYLSNAGAFPSVNDAAHILTPAGAAAGFQDGGVAFGDLDNDGHLDVLASGLDRSGARQLQVYFYNPAAGTFTTVNVPGAAGLGANMGRVALADFDLDGDLDILVSGTTTGANAGAVLRVYPNLGNRTFGAAIAVGVGLWNSDVAVGDFNNDGLPDVLAEGVDTGGVRRLRVFRNTSAAGVISFAAPIDLATGLSQGGVAWGDLNNDGFLDVVANGSTAGNNAGSQLQFYLNNGAGGFGGANTVDTVTANGAGLWGGSVAVGDTDNDGDLDILANGRDRGGARQLRVYRNNGTTPTPGFTTQAVTNVTGGAGLGYRDGGVAWGDFNNDRKIDVLVSGTDNAGTRRLRVFWNTVAQANTVPTAPTTLVSTFTFNSAGVSAATFKWNPGTDTAPGATAANMLAYDLQVSTTNAFTGVYTIPGLQTAAPLQGNYVRPPRIYDGNTNHGVMLISTAPWQAPAAPEGLRTDTTYYYRVRTYDNGLIPSGWSGTGTLWTGVAPSSVTLTAGSGPNPDNITLSWNAPGDDATKGNLTGNYRIQYSTISSTVWSLTSTPANAFTVTIATANVTPTSLQSKILNGLQDGATYYVVLWSQDDVGLWSVISNTANAMAALGGLVPPGTITLNAATGASPGQISLSWVAPGDDGFTPGTWAAAYDIRYSTTAAQSPAASNALFNTASSVAPAFGTIPAPLVEGTLQTFVLSNLLEGVTYYFAIKARDSSLNWSNLSNGATTWALRDTTPPGPPLNVSAATGGDPGDIDLTWTAPGDDGQTPGGTCQVYDIRYSTTVGLSPAVNDANFTAAASVSGFGTIPAPAVQGTIQNMALAGLLQGVTYYFAMKAADENPNWSVLSAGATAQAQVTFQSIVLDISNYDFGTVAVGLSTQTTVAVNVTYSGNVPSTFLISAATVTAGSPWSLGAATGINQAVLYGGANSTQPLITDFAAGDVISTTAQACTAGNFALVDEDCVAVLDGQYVSLWFRLDMPTKSSTVAQQQIQVTVDAGP